MFKMKQFEKVLLEKFPNGKIRKAKYYEDHGDSGSRLMLYYNITGDTLADEKHIGTYCYDNNDAWYFDENKNAVHVG